MSNTYHQISLARNCRQHSLVNHYLTLFFPKMERYLHSSRAEWFCRFLLRFTTPSSITRHRCATFNKNAWTLMGRKVNKQQFLEELYETAGQSIGLPVDSRSVAVETIRLQLERYQTLTQIRSGLEKKADDFLSDREDYRHLRTLPGIGQSLP